MFKKPDLSIIVLSYNTKELLKDCLESVCRQRRVNYEVIVVDNGSTDGSVEVVEKLAKPKDGSSKKTRPLLRLIKNQSNLGFAAGNNVGIKRVEGKYLLFLNPDTLVLPNNFKIMLKFMEENSRVGAATCRVELPDGTLDYACHRGFPTPWNALVYFSGLSKLFPKIKPLNGYTLSHLPPNKIHEIDSASGAYLMMRREAGEQVGWWDEDYFWYGEDLDLCYRLKQKGWRVMYVPKTKIVHYKGMASGIKKHSQKTATATDKTRLKATKASIEVMRIFYRKHYKNKYPKLLYWLVMTGINLLERIRLSRLKYSL